MNRNRWLVVGGICSAICLVGFRYQTPPDLSTPKLAVRSFVDALSKRDAKALAACVQGANDTDTLQDVFSLQQQEGFPEFTLVDQIEETNGDTSHIAARLSMKMRNSGSANSSLVTISSVEMFTLSKSGDSWHLISEPELLKAFDLIEDPASKTQLTVRPLATVLAIVASPKVVVKALEASRDRARSISCLSNAKQIGLGILMYLQDYDDVYPRKKASYKELIYPYIKNNDVFTCPLDAKGTLSYTINPNLQSRKLAELDSPATTVMIYEGADMKLNYRHQGRAVVGFADGHCKLISPEEAKSLIWTLPAPKPVSHGSTPKKH